MLSPYKLPLAPSGGEPLYQVAVLWVGSKRLPEATQRVCLDSTPRPFLTKIGEGQTMVNLGPLPGAACCKPEELRPDEAAPLQGGVDAQRRGVYLDNEDEALASAYFASAAAVLREEASLIMGVSFPISR
jgi:hypothetical protein